jgi:ZIP family zinc transporter
MNSEFATVLFYTIIPVVCLIVGGAIPLLHTPGPGTRSSIQHFAAGVVFAVVAAELLPDVKRAHASGTIAPFFALGVGLMLVLRHFSRHSDSEGEDSGKWPWGLLVPVGIDLLIDGMLLGIGFVAGAREGKLLAFALAVEGLSLGIATSTSFRAATRSGPPAVIGVAGCLSLIFAVGALLGWTLLSGLSGHALVGVLAFGCAALLYLVTEELLVEAHEVPETNLATTLFFVGFLIIFLVA